MTTKICSQCKQMLPATDEFFYLDRGKYRSECKICIKKIRHEQYIKNKEKYKQKSKDYHVRNKERVAATAKKYRETHAEKVKEDAKKRGAEYYKKNKERVNQKHREYYRKNKDAVCVRTSAHYRNNTEYYKEYREQNKEKLQQQMHEYYIKNKIKIRAYSRNYKARKRNAPGKHTGKDVLEIFNEQNNKCIYCGKDLTNSSFHVDHIIALINGGSNDRSNLVIACPACNLSKGKKSPEEWKDYCEKFII